MRRSIFLFVMLTGLFFVSSLVTENSQFSSSVERALNSSNEGMSVYFFYGEGCSHCARVEPFIDEMQEAYGLDVQSFEVYGNRRNLMILQDYFDKYGVPASKRGIPAVFTSASYIVGDISILDDFESLVKDSSEAGSEQFRAVSESSSGKACEAEGSERLDCLTLLTVTISAFVDSINPCSMAILFFLLAGLLLLKKRERALKVGLAFTLSVFIANLLFGLGILTTITVSSFSSVFKVTAGLIAILSGGFADQRLFLLW